jgi:multiple sugar transport system permease protein
MANASIERDSKSASTKIIKAFSYGLLVLGAILCVLPFLWMISTSLKPTEMVFSVPPRWLPNPVEWENYSTVLSKVNFGKYGLNTLKVTLIVTLGQLFTCSLAGYAFARLRFPGRDVLFVGYLATMMIPFQVMLIPNFITIRRLGLVDSHLGLVLPQLTSAFGVFLLRQFFLTFPTELEDAAKLDGCNPLQTFYLIILPLSKPILATLAVMTFQSIWNDFLWPLVMLSSEPKRTLAVGLSYLVGQYSTRWEILMAGSVLTVLPIIVLFFMAQKSFVESIKLSGLKG